MVCYVGTFSIDFTIVCTKAIENVGTLSQNFQIKNFFTKKFFSGDPSTFSETRRPVVYCPVAKKILKNFLGG